MQAILIIIGIILLYNFIVGFVIPIYRTTKKVQAQFRTMQQRAAESNHVPQNDFQSASPNGSSYQQRPVKKEYIDFEEVKD